MTKAIIKKFIFPAVLLPYLISLAGMFSPYFAFYHRDNFQQQVQRTAESELKTFLLTSEDFAALKWTEGHKEFERDGKMYDVARVVKKGDAYLVYCENDFLEDVLIGFLKTSGGKTKAKGFLHLQFTEPIPDFEFRAFTPYPGRVSDFKSEVYHSSLIEKTTPPPRLA